VFRVVVIVVGAGLFGLIMGFRSQVQPHWAKIAVAGIGGCVMGLTIAFAWRRPEVSRPDSPPPNAPR
jgi:hypothetical protein